MNFFLLSRLSLFFSYRERKREGELRAPERKADAEQKRSRGMRNGEKEEEDARGYTRGSSSPYHSSASL